MCMTVQPMFCLRQSHFVAQTDLKLMLIPAQCPECWDRHVLSYRTLNVLFTGVNETIITIVFIFHFNL